MRAEHLQHALVVPVEARRVGLPVGARLVDELHQPHHRAVVPKHRSDEQRAHLVPPQPIHLEYTRVPESARECPRVPVTRDYPRSHLVPPQSVHLGGRFRACEITRDHPRSPAIARDRPRSPEIARDHPRSPEIARDRPRSPEIARECTSYEQSGCLRTSTTLSISPNLGQSRAISGDLGSSPPADAGLSRR